MAGDLAVGGGRVGGEMVVEAGVDLLGDEVGACRGERVEQLVPRSRRARRARCPAAPAVARRPGRRRLGTASRPAGGRRCRRSVTVTGVEPGAADGDGVAGRGGEVGGGLLVEQHPAGRSDQVAELAGERRPIASRRCRRLGRRRWSGWCRRAGRLEAGRRREAAPVRSATTSGSAATRRSDGVPGRHPAGPRSANRPRRCRSHATSSWPWMPRGRRRAMPAGRPRARRPTPRPRVGRRGGARAAPSSSRTGGRSVRGASS